MSNVRKLLKQNLIQPPKFLPDNLAYETYMGSMVYGVSNKESDLDIYGFCVPNKDVVFPHLAGEILGFGRQKKRFEQWQQHHIEFNGVVYDFQIFNIVKYFHLAMENNPNIIDSLFTRNEYVCFSTEVGQMVRSNRKLFLHKGIFFKLKGYAFSQKNKMENKNPVGKRKELVERVGYDSKYLYHLVRLLTQCEQVLIEGDIDLQRNKEQLKAIRKGQWTEEEGIKWFHEKELQLEKLYHKTNALPHTPREKEIKELLLQCLEHHYGSLDNCIQKDDSVIKLQKIRQVLDGEL